MIGRSPYLETLYLLALFPSSSLAQDATYRVAIPNEQQQAEALSLIKSIFEEEYRTSQTDNEKIALAKRLLEVGIETNDDSTASYVLLRVSRDIAREIGEVVLVDKAIAELEQRFEFDVLSMKAESYASLINSVEDAEATAGLLDAMTEVVADLAMANRFDEAIVTCDLVISKAREERDSSRLQFAIEKRASLQGNLAKHAAIKEALGILSNDPIDANANLEVGKFECFAKGNWETGLKMLALGSGAEMRNLARQDMTTDDESEWLPTGDAWWTAADRLEGEEAQQAKSRAAFWYQKVVGDLSGLHRIRLEKRIKEVSP